MKACASTLLLAALELCLFGLASPACSPVSMYETYWRTAYSLLPVVFIFSFALRSLLGYRRSGVNPSGASVKR